MKVLLSSDNSEYTVIEYNPSSMMLYIDRTNSSLSPEVNKSIISSQVYLPSYYPTNQLKLRVLIDHSIVEVIANDVCCITGFVLFCVFKLLTLYTKHTFTLVVSILHLVVLIITCLLLHQVKVIFNLCMEYTNFNFQVRKEHVK